MVPAKARIIDDAVGNGPRPIAHGAPDGSRNLAIPEQDL